MYADHCKELSLPERNTYAAEEWRKLSQKDKEKYKEKTVTDPNTMTDKDRKKMVKKYTQQLKKLVCTHLFVIIIFHQPSWFNFLNNFN